MLRIFSHSSLVSFIHENHLKIINNDEPVVISILNFTAILWRRQKLWDGLEDCVFQQFSDTISTS
jgi:hypothetical protein